MPDFRFLHDSFRDYFCAEGIRGAKETEVNRWAKDYVSWGAAMHLLPDLLNEFELKELLSWSGTSDWQNNDFALDCLPRLYRRSGQAKELFALVGDVCFQKRKKEKQHLCYYAPFDDVQCTLEMAIDRFCGTQDGSTDQDYLPEVVKFALLRQWVKMSQGAVGPSVVELAWDGKYAQAVRLAQVVTKDAHEAAYRLLLLVAWITATKAGHIRSAQGQTENYRNYHDNARRTMDEALKVEERFCRIPSRKWRDTDINKFWEAFLLDLAKALLAEGLEDQAIEMIRRFGERERLKSPTDNALMPRWAQGLSFGEMPRPAYAASYYLLTVSAQLDIEVRRRLANRAEELARSLPSWATYGATDDDISAQFVELAWVGVAYASADLPSRAEKIYDELVNQWMSEWKISIPEAEQKLSRFSIRQVAMLEVLLRITRIFQELGDRWKEEHLLPLLCAAKRSLEQAGQQIQPHLNRLESLWERSEKGDGGADAEIDVVMWEELPPLFFVLYKCVRIECALLKMLCRRLPQRLQDAREEVAQSIRAIRRLSIVYLGPLWLRTMILIEMAIDLWEIQEIPLAEQALSSVIKSIHEDFTESCWKQWLGAFREWRGRCPDLWESYEDIRNTIDTALSVKRKLEWEPVELDNQVKRMEQILRADLFETAKYFEKEVIEDLHERHKRELEKYTGHFLLALLDALAGQGEAQAATEIYPLLLKGPFGLKVPESTLVEALKKTIPDETFQNELIEQNNKDTEHCYLLAVMARSFLRDKNGKGLSLLNQVLGHMNKRFWDYRLAWELLELVDDAQDRGDQEIAWIALKAVQKFSNSVIEEALKDEHGLARGLGLFSGHEPAVVLAAIAGRLYRWGKTDEGQTLFDYVLRANATRRSFGGPPGKMFILFKYMVPIEVAKELWRSGKKVKAKALLEPHVDVDTALQHRVDAVVEALVEMGESKRAYALVVKEVKSGSYDIPEATLTLAKLDRKEEALQLAESNLAHDDVRLAGTYLDLVDVLHSDDERIALQMLSSIMDRRGPQWILVKSKLLGCLRLTGVGDRQRQLAGLLQLPESASWDIADTLLANLIGLRDEKENLVVQKEILLRIKDVCQTLSDFLPDHRL